MNIIAVVLAAVSSAIDATSPSTDTVSSCASPGCTRNAGSGVYCSATCARTANDY